MAYNPDIVVGVWVGNTAPNGGGGLITAFGESVGSTMMALLRQRAAATACATGTRSRRASFTAVAAGPGDLPARHARTHACQTPGTPRHRVAVGVARAASPSDPVPTPLPEPVADALSGARPRRPRRHRRRHHSRSPAPSPRMEERWSRERQPIPAERRAPTARALRCAPTSPRTLPHSSAIVVSNRAPHEPRPEGGFARGAGGVVTALLTLAEVTAADWVACARTDAERALVAEQGPSIVAPLIRTTTRLHYVTPTPEQYEMYYSVISNPVLWFIQHYLWDLAQQPVINGRIHRAWTDGYVEVNQQVAQTVVEVGQPAAGPAARDDPRLPALPRAEAGPATSCPARSSSTSSTSHGRRRSTGRSCPRRCATRSSRACWAATSSASSRASTCATS